MPSGCQVITDLLDLFALIQTYHQNQEVFIFMPRLDWDRENDPKFQSVLQLPACVFSVVAVLNVT